MLRIVPVESLISRVRCIDIKAILDNLDDRMNVLKTKVSDGFKHKLAKTVSLGSVLLFLIAYNMTANQPIQYENETPMGIFSR